MTFRSGAFLALFLLAFCSWMIPAAAPAPAGAEGAPMTDEEIVHLVLAGTPESEILKQIRRRTPAFDLSDEMTREMKIAGVPGSILQAMQERQAEIEEKPSPADLPSALVLRFDGGKPDRPPSSLIFPGNLSRNMEEVLGLDGGKTGLKVTGAAVFVACTSPTHTPSYWRGNSPLGRDFHAMPRHRMLWFGPQFELDRTFLQKMAGKLQNETPEDRPYVVRLTVPESVRLELDPEEPHDLLIGVAIETGGRMMSLATLALPGFTADLEGKELHVKATQYPKPSFRVKLALSEHGTVADP